MTRPTKAALITLWHALQHPESITLMFEASNATRDEITNLIARIDMTAGLYLSHEKDRKVAQLAQLCELAGVDPSDLIEHKLLTAQQTELRALKES